MKGFTSIVFLLFMTIQTLNGDNQPFARKPNRRLTFFDIELLRASAEGKSGNVVISPASVKSTLALILAGAEGETAREIERALRVSRDEDVTLQLRRYLDALNDNSTKAVLQSANGVFASKELIIKPRYENIVKNLYHSEVFPVDFRDPVAAAVNINNWVSERTKGLIPSVVESIHVTPPNDLILANALYFRSTWQNAFNPRETRSTCFFRNDECTMVAMMDLETELKYAHVEDLKAHAVELPYEGNRYSMILLVPLYRDGLESLLRDLPYVGLTTILDMMQSKDVILSMPRFTVSYNVDLVDALRKTHITTVFTNRSNLTNIADRPSHVNSFHHKVFMSVDESGTVAAASSIASIVPLMFDGSVQVRADRPFLFFIRDNERDVVLFEGKIEEPTVWEDKPVDNGLILKKTSIIPIIEHRDLMQGVSTTTTSTEKPKKSKSIVQSIKNFFG